MSRRQHLQLERRLKRFIKEKSPTADQERLLAAVTWLSIAQRPLKLRELWAILEVSRAHGPRAIRKILSDSHSWTDDELRAELVHFFGRLITVTADTGNSSAMYVSFAYADIDRSITQELNTKAHRDMTEVCLKVVRAKAYYRLGSRRDSLRSPTESNEIADPLVQYAWTFWPDHLSSCETDPLEPVDSFRHHASREELFGNATKHISMDLMASLLGLAGVVANLENMPPIGHRLELLHSRKACARILEDLIQGPAMRLIDKTMHENLLLWTESEKQVDELRPDRETSRVAKIRTFREAAHGVQHLVAAFGQPAMCDSLIQTYGHDSVSALFRSLLYLANFLKAVGEGQSSCEERQEEGGNLHIVMRLRPKSCHSNERHVDELIRKMIRAADAIATHSGTPTATDLSSSFAAIPPGVFNPPIPIPDFYPSLPAANNRISIPAIPGTVARALHRSHQIRGTDTVGLGIEVFTALVASHLLRFLWPGLVAPPLLLLSHDAPHNAVMHLRTALGSPAYFLAEALGVSDLRALHDGSAPLDDATPWASLAAIVYALAMELLRQRFASRLAGPASRVARAAARDHWVAASKPSPRRTTTTTTSLPLTTVESDYYIKTDCLLLLVYALVLGGYAVSRAVSTAACLAAWGKLAAGLADGPAADRAVLKLLLTHRAYRPRVALHAMQLVLFLRFGLVPLILAALHRALFRRQPALLLFLAGAVAAPTYALVRWPSRFFVANEVNAVAGFGAMLLEAAVVAGLARAATREARAERVDEAALESLATAVGEAKVKIREIAPGGITEALARVV